MIWAYFKQFFEYFKDYRKSFFKYSLLSVVAGGLELLGVALTYPFILKILQKDSENSMLSTFMLGGLIILLFLTKNAFMIFYTQVQAKYTTRFEGDVKKQFIKYCLNGEYRDVSKISFVQKSKIFGLLIPNIMNNYILRLLNLNINILIFILISALIAVKFPFATAISAICAIILIKMQEHVFKPIIAKVAETVSKYTNLYNQSFNEIVLGLKEIKVLNNEKYFYEKFENCQDIYLKNRQIQTFINIIPPFIVEPFIVVLLFVLLTVISIQMYETPDKLVASYALIASAVFRLAPTISRIQINLNGINNVLPFVREFLDIYKDCRLQNNYEITSPKYMTFNDSIELKNISFAYDKKDIIKDLNLIIKKGEAIGIAGFSGAGKTTIADIIAGLYKPKCGNILVDGTALNGSLKIAYIPQEFRLISGSIRENVAFGNPDIDDEKVIDALKKAQLYDFVINNFKEGIYANPFVDSTGFSLGQKQRIAIARALYSDSEILILDEATSSLDLKTEDELCNILKSLKGQKTIIIIAHRLSTIKFADRIVFINEGEVSQAAPYEQLIEISEGFRNLVELNIKD